jgi:DNA-binding MarR family transcriptional regulator
VDEPTDELVNAVLDASRSLVRIIAVSIESAPVEVTLAQFRALVVLSTRGPCQMSVLAQDLQIAPSTTTRMVERLERKGLVLREASPASRRAVELVLTELGGQIVAHVTAIRRREVERALAAIPPSRRSAALQGFTEFARAADGAAPGAPHRSASLPG